MNYATKEDLAAWLGYIDETGQPDVSQLPPNAEKLIKNGSRLIDAATMNRIGPRLDVLDPQGQTYQHIMEVAKNATTAQCEFWIDGLDESVDIIPDIPGYSAGKTSIQFAGGHLPKLAPRARRELWLGGLSNNVVVRQ